jgi:hypothetical protein
LATNTKIDRNKLKQREVMAQCDSCRNMEFVNVALSERRIVNIDCDSEFKNGIDLAHRGRPKYPKCHCGGTLHYKNW